MRKLGCASLGALIGLVLSCASACNDRDTKPNDDAPPPKTPRSSQGSSSQDSAQGSAGSAADMCSELGGGTYLGTFEERSGDCGPLAVDMSFMLTNNITIEKHVAVEIETETIFKGCTLFLRQTVRDKDTGIVAMQMEAPELEIDADGAISGDLSLRRFDERGVPACAGEYRALFEESDSSIGAAAGSP